MMMMNKPRYAQGFLSGLKLRDTATGDERKLAVKGLFYGIGHSPNSGFFSEQVETDGEGYVVVKDGGAGTSVEGVFSAGDLHDKEWCQAVTAAGSGCMAAISAERYLGSKGLLVDKEAEMMSEEAASSSSSAGNKEKEEKLLAAVQNSDKAATTTTTTTAKEKEEVEEENAATFDVTKVRHKGQFALRKLYHESDRVLFVLYSGPNCGPCKRLKPMLDKVGWVGGDGGGWHTLTNSFLTLTTTTA